MLEKQYHTVATLHTYWILCHSLSEYRTVKRLVASVRATPCGASSRKRPTLDFIPAETTGAHQLRKSGNFFRPQQTQELTPRAQACENMLKIFLLIGMPNQKVGDDCSVKTDTQYPSLEAFTFTADSRILHLGTPLSMLFMCKHKTMFNKTLKTFFVLLY